MPNKKLKYDQPFRCHKCFLHIIFSYKQKSATAFIVAAWWLIKTIKRATWTVAKKSIIIRDCVSIGIRVPQTYFWLLYFLQYLLFFFFNWRLIFFLFCLFSIHAFHSLCWWAPDSDAYIYMLCLLTQRNTWYFFFHLKVYFQGISTSSKSPTALFAVVFHK